MSRFSAFVVAVCLALPTAARDELTAATVIATVNGEDITLGHLLLLREQVPPEYLGLEDDLVYEFLLEQLIRQTALSQRMEKTEQTAAGEDNAVRGYRADLVLNRAIEARVTKEAVRAAFDDEVRGLDEVVEWNASHILVETEEEADLLLAEMEAGADFAELAMEKSTGPSGPRGGALGWFSDGMMVESFQAAVENLRAGEISGPVETRFGWHVIKLNESRMVAPLVFEEVADQLRDALTNETILSVVDEAVAISDISRVEGIDPSVVSVADFWVK